MTEDCEQSIKLSKCFSLVQLHDFTNLAASVPQRHWVVVGGIGSGTCWIDAAQLVHIMTDVGICCRRHIKTQEQSYVLS